MQSRIFHYILYMLLFKSSVKAVGRRKTQRNPKKIQTTLPSTGMKQPRKDTMVRLTSDTRRLQLADWLLALVTFNPADYNMLIGCRFLVLVNPGRIQLADWLIVSMITHDNYSLLIGLWLQWPLIHAVGWLYFGDVLYFIDFDVYIVHYVYFEGKFVS